MHSTKPGEPIRVAKKRKAPSSRKAQKRHVFLDDRGFPDRMNDFEDMLPEVRGKFIRKRRHPAWSLDDIDPEFNV